SLYFPLSRRLAAFHLTPNHRVVLPSLPVAEKTSGEWSLSRHRKRRPHGPEQSHGCLVVAPRIPPAKSHPLRKTRPLGRWYSWSDSIRLDKSLFGPAGLRKW